MLYFPSRHLKWRCFNGKRPFARGRTGESPLRDTARSWKAPHRSVSSSCWRKRGYYERIEVINFRRARCVASLHRPPPLSRHVAVRFVTSASLRSVTLRRTRGESCASLNRMFPANVREAPPGRKLAWSSRDWSNSPDVSQRINAIWRVTSRLIQ